MLFAIFPSALVLSAILPDELAVAVSLVLSKVALILFTIWPDQMPVTVHFIVNPSASVILLVGPDIDTLSLNLIHFECTLVYGAIRKLELSSAVLLPLVVLSLVHRVIGPSLPTKTMLLIVTPSACILCAVRVSVDALAVGFIIDPVTLINIAICVMQRSLSISFAEVPLSLIV